MMREDHLEMLVATTNRGKLSELEGLLQGLPLDLVTLGDLRLVAEVEETGTTFIANAEIKASAYARRSSLFTVADDSGLEVRSLSGRPGVHTARYGGPNSSFDEKMRLLLHEMESTGDDRTARFVCAVSLADQFGRNLFSTVGICDGHIAPEPRGSLGFGYDPVFVPDGYELTFGELSADIKQKISHRARAFAQIIPFLRDFIAIMT